MSTIDIDIKKKVLQVCSSVASKDLSINRHFCSAVEVPDPFAILIPMAVFCLIAVAIVYTCVKNMRKGLAAEITVPLHTCACTVPNKSSLFPGRGGGGGGGGGGCPLTYLQHFQMYPKFVGWCKSWLRLNLHAIVL